MTTSQAGQAVLLPILDTLRTNKEYLSELDGAAGDGDHGINMAKGAAMALKAIADRPRLGVSEGFEILGDTLLTQIGGSMGPLYGSFFLGLADGFIDDDGFTPANIAHTLRAGYARVRTMTTAVVGDKTMIDALDPAVLAFDSKEHEGAGLDACLSAMTSAAHAGAASTIGIPAKIGRAARLGDRTIGNMDPGAASCALILQAIADGVRASEGEEQ